MEASIARVYSALNSFVNAFFIYYCSQVLEGCDTFEALDRN